MKHWSNFFFATAILASVSVLHAQQQDMGPGGAPGGGPGAGPGGPDGGPDGGPPDPQEMQMMMDKRIKSAMNTTDDAWATLKPLIDKVQQLEHDSDTGPLMHGPPPRRDDDDGNGPDDGGPPKTATENAISNLKQVLSDKSSTEDQITAATKAVEDAEQKAKDDLEAARKELKAVVNLRQKAVLVALGVLN